MPNRLLLISITVIILLLLFKVPLSTAGAIIFLIVIWGIYLLRKIGWLIKKVFNGQDIPEPNKNIEVDLTAPTKEDTDSYSYYSYRIFAAINERTANESEDNNKIKMYSLGRLGVINIKLLIIKFFLYIFLAVALSISWIDNSNSNGENVVKEFLGFDINITFLGSVVFVCIIALFEIAHHFVNIYLYSRGVFAAAKDRQVSQREINQMKQEIKALQGIIDPFKEKNDI